MNIFKLLSIIILILGLSLPITASLNNTLAAPSRHARPAAAAASAAAGAGAGQDLVVRAPQTQVNLPAPGLIKPLTPYTGPDQKKHLFEAIAKKDARALYMTHSQTIRNYLSKPEISEIRQQLGEQEKYILCHATDNNDVDFVKEYIQMAHPSNNPFPSISFFQQACSVYTARGLALCYASELVRPYVFLALLPELSTQEDIIYYYRNLKKKIIASDLKTYQQTLALMDVKQKEQFNGVMKIIGKCTPLILDLAQLIAQMEYPTLKANDRDQTITSIMHPKLEQAIAVDDLEAFISLANAGWLTAPGTDQGLKPLALAVDRGRKKIVIEIIGYAQDGHKRETIGCIPFVAQHARKQLKENAIERANHFKKLMEAKIETENGLNTKVMYQNYVEIIGLIDTYESKSEARNKPLRNAILNNQPTRFLVELELGANPNTLDAEGRPIVLLALKNYNEAFLSMLINTQAFDSNVTIPNSQGNACTLLTWAVIENKHRPAQILLDAGYNPHVLDPKGKPLSSYPLCKELLEERQKTAVLTNNDAQNRADKEVYQAMPAPPAAGAGAVLNSDSAI